MATTGKTDLKCPRCKVRIGSRPASRTSGGSSIVCTKCHIRVDFVYDKNGTHVKKITPTSKR